MTPAKAKKPKKGPPHDQTLAFGLTPEEGVQINKPIRAPRPTPFQHAVLDWMWRGRKSWATGWMKASDIASARAIQTQLPLRAQGSPALVGQALAALYQKGALERRQAAGESPSYRLPQERTA